MRRRPRPDARLGRRGLRAGVASNRSASSVARSEASRSPSSSGGGEGLVRGGVVGPDPVDEVGQSRLALGSRLLHVDELGHAVGSEPVLVLQPRDLVVGRDPAVALGVQARRTPRSARGTPGRAPGADAAGRRARTSPAPVAAARSPLARHDARRRARAGWNSRTPAAAGRACGSRRARPLSPGRRPWDILPGRAHRFRTANGGHFRTDAARAGRPSAPRSTTDAAADRAAQPLCSRAGRR